MKFHYGRTGTFNIAQNATVNSRVIMPTQLPSSIKLVFRKFARVHEPERPEWDA